MDTIWNAILWQQFGASIGMLENALVACPDELWGDRSDSPLNWSTSSFALIRKTPKEE